jgi:hypothetical protein
MRRFLAVAAMVIAAVLVTGVAAQADSAHFVQDQTWDVYTADGVSLHATEAGLGYESAINVELSVQTQCIDSTSTLHQHSVSTQATELVRYGEATYQLSVTGLHESCAPGETLRKATATAIDSTNGISQVVGEAQYH